MDQIRSNPLDITPAERKLLRRAGIRIKEIHLHKLPELQTILNVSKIRAMELYALSEFQSLPSIGIRFAYDLISMGYYSLKQLKDKDGAKLLDQFERQSGVWVDPCVEDQFRLVVYYAKHPESKKNWWDFTTERKAFRTKNGYPATRPKQPWFELSQYQVHNQLPAKKKETKKDLHSRLRSSISFMKKNLSQTITLEQLADASNISSFHFLRNFKSAYAKTPFQYLTEIRLKHACKLLRDTESSITEVMTACGFENLSSFVRLFKRRFGKTPGEYRGS